MTTIPLTTDQTTWVGIESNGLTPHWAGLVPVGRRAKFRGGIATSNPY